MAIELAILGAGAWGTAMAVVLAQSAEHRVLLWSARPENAKMLRDSRENVRLLPGVPIPSAVVLTSDIGEITGADLVIEAIPTVHLRPTLERIAHAIPTAKPVLSLTKGMELATFLRPSQIIEQVLGPRPLAALSGPSHAEEVGRGLPTGVVVASADFELACWVQQRFGTDRFRVYTNQDIVGVELAGALKNIIGIAAGISDGLGFGDNTKSALLTRGLVEIARFGVALGGDAQTFWGLAGIGDLITTCISRHGRNRRVGECLARGETLATIVSSTAMVAEGVTTTRSVHERAVMMGIPMPITTEVYRVLYEGKDPREAVTDLMLRDPRSEK
ncbi:MAG: NAD(P)-dependent glycerol-3-phosphate dehydrogenase [Planctomycetes bacterium]|nr:NAD(P)-dependent glycerol-3-phosphate dehydrogenase [Planctomycetota bacterium]